ncbi:hypothetical protein ACOME3_008059 [Neoechinorhynchus agilis]
MAAIPNSIIQGVIDNAKSDICAAIGCNGPCCLVLTKYRIISKRINAFTIIARIHINNCEYCDVRVRVEHPISGQIVASLQEVIKCHVDPGSSLSMPD